MTITPDTVILVLLLIVALLYANVRIKVARMIEKTKAADQSLKRLQRRIDSLYRAEGPK